MKLIVRLSVAALLLAGAAPRGRAQSRDGLKVQKARAEHVTSRGKQVYYTQTFDLSGLPAYQPEQTVTGTIRLWGNNYIADSNLGADWEQGFRKYHPGVKFDYSGLKSGLIATAGLVSGRADIVGNRRITFAELESFERMFNYDPLEITMAMGSYNVPGWMTTFCIVVHKDNPLAQLSLQQLDGIFGAERDGGWEGTTWHTDSPHARSAKENIRTWGQLGLTGEWADKPINIYGLNLRYNNCDMFEHVVFHGGDKWNEHLREYANYAKADGTLAIA
ncbi:MAG: phosphate ABC transporter substrate-binding protein, partial [Opitutaceae bacterium]